jgi:hypothetical protein
MARTHAARERVKSSVTSCNNRISVASGVPCGSEWRPLLRKCAVNTFLQQWINTRNKGSGVFCGSAPRLDTEDLTQSDCYNYRDKICCQETSSEDKILLCVLWLQWYWSVVQWDCYNYCVKIRCQEMSSIDKIILCELWLRWKLQSVVQWGCYIWLWWRSVSGR